MKNIPFYANTSDDMHCVQAALMMLLKYFYPGKTFTFEELDSLTRHRSGMFTWLGDMLLELSKMGFEIISIENLDYAKFAQEGKGYLSSVWSEEVFSTQNQYSDLDHEQSTAQKVITDPNIKLIQKEIEIGDIEKYFLEGYFLLVSLNPLVLQGKEGYWSHLVVVTNITEDAVYIHDPGLPPLENRRVPKTIFTKAVTKPGKEDTNLVAIKKLVPSTT